MIMNMKSIFAVLAAAASMAVSCEKPSETITPGSTDPVNPPASLTGEADITFATSLTKTALGMKDYSGVASYDFTFERDLTATDGRIYVNPFIRRFHSKDSFQSITREYPIDFPYPYGVSYMFSMDIPEGYAVEQVPENALIKFPGLDATLKVMTNVSESEIMLMFNYTQNNMVGQVEDYPAIRALWQYINEVYESMIVLKKI